MSIRFSLTAHDFASAPDILRSDETGKYVARQEFADLACAGCGKLNERAAFIRGLDHVPAFRCSRSMFCSNDALFVGDSNFTRLLDQLLPGAFGFYVIPSNPRYYVIDANDSIAPSQGDVGYRFIKPCKVCGRFEQLLWSGEPPRIPNRPFVSIDLELRIVKTQAWLFAKDLADELRRHKPTMKGMCLSKHEVVLLE